MKHQILPTLLRVVVICWLTLFFPLAAATQTVDVTLRGMVVDESRLPLPGAIVIASNIETGVVLQSVTDEQGRYVVSRLRAGTYNVQVGLSGFATQVRRGQVFYVGTTISLDVTLTIAALNETVVVTGEAPFLEVTKSTLPRVEQQTELDASRLSHLTRRRGELESVACLWADQEQVRCRRFGKVAVEG